jgi:hypothetical protein
VWVHTPNTKLQFTLLSAIFVPANYTTIAPETLHLPFKSYISSLKNMLGSKDSIIER